MCDPALGETNSPDTADSNAQERAGAETSEGLSWSALHSGAASGMAERRLIDTLRRQRVRREIARTREACERRPGEIRAKVDVAGPREGNPMGGTSGCRPKTPCDRQGLSGGMSPETAAPGSGPALRRWVNRWAKR